MAPWVMTLCGELMHSVYKCNEQVWYQEQFLIVTDLSPGFRPALDAINKYTIDDQQVATGGYT